MIKQAELARGQIHHHHVVIDYATALIAHQAGG